jgi:hypothetical protein
MDRRKAQPPSVASISIQKTIWSTELRIEIATQMVQDVREDLKSHFNGCCVCYMIVGKEDKSHISGTSCRTLPLDGSTDGWAEFKGTLKFIPGIFCWTCLLPTVWTASFLVDRLHISPLLEKKTEHENELGRCRIPRLSGLPAPPVHSASLVRFFQACPGGPQGFREEKPRRWDMGGRHGRIQGLVDGPTRKRRSQPPRTILVDSHVLA